MYLQTVAKIVSVSHSIEFDILTTFSQRRQITVAIKGTANNDVLPNDESYCAKQIVAERTDVVSIQLMPDGSNTFRCK